VRVIIVFRLSCLYLTTTRFVLRARTLVTRYVTTCVITPSPPQVSHRERARVGAGAAPLRGGPGPGRRDPRAAHRKFLSPKDPDTSHLGADSLCSPDHARPRQTPAPPRNTPRESGRRACSEVRRRRRDETRHTSRPERKGVVGGRRKRTIKLTLSFVSHLETRHPSHITHDITPFTPSILVLRYGKASSRLTAATRQQSPQEEASKRAGQHEQAGPREGATARCSPSSPATPPHRVLKPLTRHAPLRRNR
jgi:hypothetical protein